MLKYLKSRERLGQEVMEIEAALLEKYKDSNLAEKPAERARGRVYSVAVSLIESILNNLRKRYIVNVQNNGAMPILGGSGGRVMHRWTAGCTL